MGQIDSYALLKEKKRICSKDIQEIFHTSQPNASRIINKLFKYDDVGEEYEMRRRSDGAQYMVRYLVIKKR